MLTKIGIFSFLMTLLVACTATPASTPTPFATPSISEPKIGSPDPKRPNEEIGISVDVAATTGLILKYEWLNDGQGEIIRGQDTPAVTYRTPKEAGTYNVRVRVSWDGGSVEKATTVKVEAASPVVSAPKVEPVATTAPQSIATNIPVAVAVDTATPLPTFTSAPLPTATLVPINPPPPSNSDGYCYGNCWQYDDVAKTMTWTRHGGDTEDIWEPQGEALQKIRDGYTAIINTSVSGEILACILTINGTSVKNNCDGVLHPISPGTYQITSASTDIGGFRWCSVNRTWECK